MQSHVVSDLYGNDIASKLVQDDAVMTVFNARNFTFDRSRHSRSSLGAVITETAETARVNSAVFLEEPSGLTKLDETYIPLLSATTEFNDVALRAASLANEDWTPVYVISDTTRTAALRQAWLGQTGVDLTVRRVRTLAEFRSTIYSLNDEPKGTIVLNAFTLLDEWNKPIGYTQIEKAFVSARSKHVDVGVCRPGFLTTFALGPSVEEAANVVRAVLRRDVLHPTGSCVNLKRAATSNVYRSALGRFDMVQP